VELDERGWQSRSLNAKIHSRIRRLDGRPADVCVYFGVVEIHRDMEKTKIESDEPIASASEDKFARVQFAHRIAETILHRKDPSSVVIGITAPWGEGKTSVLNMIQGRLAAENSLIIEFNPWRFTGEESLLRNFYLTLASTLGVEIETTKEKLGAWLRAKAKMAGVLSMFGIDGEKAASGVLAVLSEPAIEDLRNRINDALDEQKKWVVILMDDIDRLDVDEIQSVFRLIKLSASFPYTAYVVSFDETRVAEALSIKFGNSTESGRKFLEKIVQVSLPLPPASGHVLAQMMVDGINAILDSNSIETTENDNKRFSEYFAKAFRPRIASPRLVKRFNNAIAFGLPILKGEVNPTDLIFLEGIKVFYPDLHRTLREYGEKILLYTVGDEILGRKDDKIGEEINDAIRSSLRAFPESSRSGIELLLQDLFPGLSGLEALSRPYVTFSDEDAVKSKRLSTREYFWRYFSYGIQPYDISDIEVVGFLKAIPDKDAKYVEEHIRKFIEETPSRFDTLINKLRLHEGTLDEQTATTLAKGLSGLSKSFPQSHPDDSVLGFGTRSQIARLHMHLVRRIPEETRVTVLEELIKNTPDPIYAYQLADMMRAFGDKIETTEKGFVVISEGMERKVNCVLVKRLANLAPESPFEELDFGWSQELYMFWFLNGADSLSAHLEKLISTNSVSLLKCLGAFVRFDVGGQSGFTFSIARNVNLFAILSSVTNLEQVVQRLETDILCDSSKTGLNEKAIEFARTFVDHFRNGTH